MDCWKKKEKIRKSIGIAGSVCGSGATHLSVALANYAASALGENTACLELGRQGEFAYWKTASPKGYFKDSGIDYYPGMKMEHIPTLLNCGYETIIMDFGNDYQNCFGEILRCDRKIILLNLNPWQEFAAKKLVQAVQSEKWGNTVPVYAGIHLHEPIKKALEKEFQISIVKLPFIPDPTRINPEAFPSLDYLLCYNAANYKRIKALPPIWKKI